MKLRDDVNEFGTPVTWFSCDTCGDEYSICPCPTNLDNWQNCLSEACASYDIDRDADILLGKEKPDGEQIIQRRAIN